MTEPRPASAFLWFVKPTDAPLATLWKIVVLLFVINALVLLFVLRTANVFVTGPYGTDTKLAGVPFEAQLAVLAFGATLLQIVPKRVVKPLLVVQGIACLLPYGIRFALAALGALVVWFFALKLPIAVKYRFFVPLFLVAGTAALGASKVIIGPFAFSMFFTMRLMLYAWEQHQNGYPPRSALDFSVYMLAAPLLFTYPYMLFIPNPSIVEKIEPRLTERTGRRVLAYLTLGLAMNGALWLLSMFRVPPLTMAGAITANYVLHIVQLGRLAHIVFALLVLHGIHDRVPLNAPLLATDFVDMWRRYQIHQKDLQVTLFYNPALIAFRRANRYVAITVAVFWTMFVGNLVIHSLARYSYTPGRWLPLLWSRLIFFAAGGTVLAATLCLQEWRRRKRHPVPKGWLGRGYTAVCWILTQSFTAVLMNLP